MNRTKQTPSGREGGREMIASAIKVNVATVTPRETRIVSVCNPYYSRGIPVYRKTTMS